MTRAPSEANERLDPWPSHPRYYHLRLLRQAIEALVPRLASTDVLVDLGCGAMPYRSLLEPHVRQYLGADLGGNSLADLHVGHGSRVPLPDSAVDIVLSTQVLEHVESPSHYLAEARRLLRPGGTLVLSTHGMWIYHPDPVDLWRWTEAGLRGQLADGGFEVETVQRLMGLASTAMQLLQDALMHRLPAWFRPPFTWIMQRLIALADRYDNRVGGADACVLFVVAKRGS